MAVRCCVGTLYSRDWMLGRFESCLESWQICWISDLSPVALDIWGTRHQDGEGGQCFSSGEMDVLKLREWSKVSHMLSGGNIRWSPSERQRSPSNHFKVRRYWGRSGALIVVQQREEEQDSLFDAAEAAKHPLAAIVDLQWQHSNIQLRNYSFLDYFDLNFYNGPQED